MKKTLLILSLACMCTIFSGLTVFASAPEVSEQIKNANQAFTSAIQVEEFPANSYDIIYSSNENGYAYIFTLRSNGDVELTYPKSANDNNTIVAGKEYSYAQVAKISTNNRIQKYDTAGEESLILFVVPEKLNSREIKWLYNNFEMSRDIASSYIQNYLNTSFFTYSPKLNSSTANEFFQELKQSLNERFDSNWSSTSFTYSFSNVIPQIYSVSYASLSTSGKKDKTKAVLNGASKYVEALAAKNYKPNSSDISREDAFNIALKTAFELTKEYKYYYDSAVMENYIAYCEGNSSYNGWWEVCLSYSKSSVGNYAIDFLFSINASTGEIVHTAIIRKTLPEDYDVLNSYVATSIKSYTGDFPVTLMELEFLEDTSLIPFKIIQLEYKYR